MIFTNDQLQKMIKGQPVGESYPYNQDDEGLIENFIKRIYYQLKKSRVFHYEADFEHFGSGYASFVCLFLTLKNGTSVMAKREYGAKQNTIIETDLEGICVYISRLAPVAVFNRGEYGFRKVVDQSGKVLSEQQTYNTWLLRNELNELPDKSWQWEWQQLKKQIEEYGILFLEEDYLKNSLSFLTEIPTILVDKHHHDLGQYRNFDAIFYWED
ncbi:putative isomerase [Bacillus sp. TS-2]|nr:putative isomerase [Bacillus sp. TS-2]